MRVSTLCAEPDNTQCEAPIPKALMEVVAVFENQCALGGAARLR